MKGSFFLQQLRQNLTPAATAHGAENTAPAAGAVLADSGALANTPFLQPNNFVLVLASVATTDAAANLIQLVHRNAANNADLELEDGQSGVAAGEPGESLISGIFLLQALGERFVVRNKNAGTAALFYQANVYVFPLPA
jgi:hypothetical protein